MVDPAKGAELERLGRDRDQHPLRAGRQGRPDRADGAAAEAEVGLRVSGRDLGAIAARRRRRTAVRRQRGRRSVLARREDRLHVLGVPRASRASGARCRSASTRGARGAAPYAIFFTDFDGNVYGVDANSGTQLWTRKVEDHPQARATGSATYYNGRLYVPMAGIGEEAVRAAVRITSAARSAAASPRSTPTPARSCGRRTRSPRSRRSAASPRKAARPGDPRARASGRRRRSTRAAACSTSSTGNGYADPPQPTTDAVLAMDLDTGKVKWVAQPGAQDVWMGGCKPENPDNPRCPAKMGPDHDFSSSPSLAKRSNGSDILIIPSKSGMLYAFDPGQGGRAGLEIQGEQRQRPRRAVGIGAWTTSRPTSASTVRWGRRPAACAP